MVLSRVENNRSLQKKNCSLQINTVGLQKAASFLTTLSRRASSIALLLGLALCLPTAALAEVAAVSNDVQALETLLANWQTVQGDFKQKVYDENEELMESTTGNMHLKKGGKFRWEVVSRDRSLIVADGEQIWHYDPDLEQVTVEKFDPNGTSPLLFLTGKTQQLGSVFQVAKFTGKGSKNQALCQSATGACFEMKPRDPESSFQWIRIGFDKDQLSSLEFADQLGQHGWIYFNKLQVNKPIPDSMFHFKPPKGVDVVRRS